MLLHTLMKLITNHCYVTDELRVYIYDGYIQFVDHTDYEYTNPKTNELVKEEFNGVVFTMSYDTETNEITTIEPSSNVLFTPANKNMYKFLLDLIGQQIENLNSYPVNEGREKDIYQSL